MSDRIEGEDGATYGLSDAQSAIADFLAPQEDNAGRLQEQVDESDEGEADFDEDEYAEDALESDEEEAVSPRLFRVGIVIFVHHLT